MRKRRQKKRVKTNVEIEERKEEWEQQKEERNNIKAGLHTREKGGAYTVVFQRRMLAVSPVMSV